MCGLLAGCSADPTGDSAGGGSDTGNSSAGGRTEFVELSGGTFDMGIVGGEDDELPVHQVTLTTGLSLGRAEVTQAGWEAVVGDREFAFDGCPECPAETLSWSDAAIYCNERSAAEGFEACFLEDGSDLVGNPYECGGYRMPTEAEWEYAARAGELTTYSGSYEADEVAWSATNSDSTTHASCELQANAWELCDMSGNVGEWVLDWYGEYASESVTNPVGTETGEWRVVRGGDFTSVEDNVRVANRAWDSPSTQAATFGFRLARSTP